jgi:hypothetical protein
MDRRVYEILFQFNQGLEGLLSRLVILPDWNFHDGKRYEKEPAEKRKLSTNKRRRTTKRTAPHIRETAQTVNRRFRARLHTDT